MELKMNSNGYSNYTVRYGILHWYLLVIYEELSLSHISYDSAILVSIVSYAVPSNKNVDDPGYAYA